MKLRLISQQFLLLPLACSSGHQTPSRLNHDLGRTVNERNSYQWIDTTDEQYAAVVVPGQTGAHGELLLAKDAPATQRLQFWLDRLDGMLRARDPQGLAGVPKPKANVVVSAHPNVRRRLVQAGRS